ncbi:MAG: putative rane protein [Clostridia bacterium]|jgi:transporter family-2 protein|nr:putative rane protein [Clostridia bacterium]
MLIAIVVAITAGASIVIARNVNSILAEKDGLLTSTFFNYATGFSLSAVFLLISSESIKQSYDLMGTVPLWAYLGGLFGVAVVAISNIVTSKISAFYMSLIIFVGQLFTGIIIDYFALGILSIGKVLGGLLVVAGLIYNLYVDK